MPAEPILTQIESNMYTLISELSPDDYHFDWQSVNEWDVAKQNFPSALIYLIDEECQDFDRNALGTRDYYQECTFEIHVIAELTTETDNPVFEINAELNKALDDLKKCFGINWTINGTADTIMYAGSRRERRQTGDIMLPSKLITKWQVVYEQDRKYPSMVAGA